MDVDTLELSYPIFNPPNQDNPSLKYLKRYEELKENDIGEALRVAALFEPYAFGKENLQQHRISALYYEHERYIQSQEDRITAPLQQTLPFALNGRLELQELRDWRLVGEINEVA